MRIAAVLVLLAAFEALCATPWKLVLKTGATIECDSPAVIINGTYLYRGTDGKDGSVAAAQVDVEKTAGANKTGSASQWRQVGETKSAAPRGFASADGRVGSLNERNFNSEVLNSDAPVLVNFYTTWCPVCRKTAPTVDTIAGEYTGKVKVARMDAEENAKTAARYDIHSYPTLVLFRNGQVVDQIVGGPSHNKLAKMLDSHL